MIDMKAVSFFDSSKVTRAVKSGIRAALSKAGAFVRTAARSLIRNRKRASEPGQPPSGHVGTLKRLIFFGYEHATESVVVGPLQFKSAAGTTNGASLLELGGTTTLNTRGKRQRARYRARPFMAPALEQEAPNFPNLFHNSVRG